MNDCADAFRVFLGQQQFDKRENQPLEKVNYRVENAQIKQHDDNQKSISFKPEKEILDAWRCEAHKNFRPVEGRQWNQIKSRQDDVDLGKIVEKLRRYA